MVALANPLVQLRSLALARRLLSPIASRYQLVVLDLSQAKGIAGQQTEMAGMTASGMAKIAGRVEDSDSECFSSNVRCTQSESNEYLRSTWRPMLLATLAVSAHDSALAKSAEIASARIGASL